MHTFTHEQKWRKGVRQKNAEPEGEIWDVIRESIKHVTPGSRLLKELF